MKISDHIAAWCSGAGASLKTLVKVAAQSRPVHITPGDGPRLIIMGNGPSLRDDIDRYGDVMARSVTMAVNFAANAPEFFSLRPRYYVLADPHFFSGGDDPNVSRLLSNLSRVDWPMTLFVPRTVVVPPLSGSVKVERFNMVGASGWTSLCDSLFSRRLAMPRPRNVLIPSIMIGIWLGFREIFILGADHSWLRTLDVDDDNTVISIQPHFYEEDGNEKKRVSAVYRDVRLHQILESFSIAFAAYHDIARWAAAKGVEIFNATPGSFIDAFPRRTPWS